MKVIDIHIHGGFGISFDSANAEELRKFCALAYEKGIEAFCPTLTGNTPEKLYERLQIINEVKQTQKKGEAKIIGANLEGTFLSKNRPGVQNPDVFLEPTIENFENITKDLKEIVKIVVVAPENENYKSFVNYLKGNDIKVHYGHTIAEEIEGADGICHLFNAMEPMTHKKETAAIKALLDDKIYTELIADTIHVNKDVLRLVFKVRPSDKIILISDALPIAGSNLESIIFCGKKVLNAGLDENGTLGGAITLLPDIVKNLDKQGILPLEAARKMAYDNPKDYLKLIL